MEVATETVQTTSENYDSSLLTTIQTIIQSCGTLDKASIIQLQGFLRSWLPRFQAALPLLLVNLCSRHWWTRQRSTTPCRTPVSCSGTNHIMFPGHHHICTLTIIPTRPNQTFDSTQSIPCKAQLWSTMRNSLVTQMLLLRMVLEVRSGNVMQTDGLPHQPVAD